MYKTMLLQHTLVPASSLRFTVCLLAPGAELNEALYTFPKIPEQLANMSTTYLLLLDKTVK